MFIKVKISQTQVRAINLFHIISVTELSASMTEIKTSDKVLTDVSASMREVLSRIEEVANNGDLDKVIG